MVCRSLDIQLPLLLVARLSGLRATVVRQGEVTENETRIGIAIGFQQPFPVMGRSCASG